MTLRCVIDGLLLPAFLQSGCFALLALDGDSLFCLEALEALFYELLSATPDELVALELSPYRLLRRAADFHPPA